MASRDDGAPHDGTGARGLTTADPARLALLDAAVREAGEAVLITTADLDLPGPQIVFANPAACRLTGFAVHELLGRTPRVLQGPDTDRAVLDRMRAQLSRGAVFAGRTVNYRKDGTAYVVDWQVTPVRAAGDGPDARGADARGADAGGPVTHFVAVQRDVTALVRADAERAGLFAAAEHARAEAEAANRAKSEFLAVMSHELRTPLNAIAGYAELIELGIYGPVTDAQRTALELVQRAQRHLLGLINGVLNYAKVDAGAVQYAVEDVPLDEVLRTCEALVSPQVRARGLSCAYAGCDPALRVRADRDKVQQVVLNLLSNAVKFTEPGGRVMVAGAGDAAGGAVRVTVADTGIGIAADQLARVFAPFVQVDARLTRTREGTGLGLAISRDLARGMGGDLTAESTPGGGSTFTLTLPVRSVPAT